MKQLAVLVIVAACGSSRTPAEQRPVAPPVVDEDTGPPAPKSDPDEPGPASVVSPPDAGAPSTSGDRPSYVVGTVDNTKALADAPDMETTTENGVTVIKTNHPMWCGQKKGICNDTTAVCKAAYGTCEKRDDYACVSFDSRTSGKSIMLCVRDYGVCEQARGVVSRNADHTNIGDCFIVRHKG